MFRDVKSVVDTRPVFHAEETIRGRVSCGFLTLVLHKETDRHPNAAGHIFEREDIKRDLNALKGVVIEDDGRRLAVRKACARSCGKVFQAVGVALPPTVREV